MRLIVSLLSFVILTRAQAPKHIVIWDKEPDGFKGVKFGSSEDDAKKIVKFDRECKLDYKSENRTRCGISFKVTDGFGIMADLVFVDHRLHEVAGKFSSEAWDDIKDAFRYKYGQPSTDDNSLIQNQAGATFEQEILTWAGFNVVIVVRKYADKLDEGSLSIMLKKDVEEEHGAREAMKRKALD